MRIIAKVESSSQIDYNNETIPKNKNLLYIALAFALGVFLGYAYLSHEIEPRISLIREDTSEYQYINPILLIENSDVKFPEYDTLRSYLEDFIQQAKSNGEAESISVYFRDLNTSKWTGVDEDELYSPSSMLKMVTLLAYLKAEQDDSDLLKESLSYQPSSDPGQNYKPVKLLSAGYHTVRDLLVQMIIESDNNAMRVLNARLPEGLDKVYRELQLPDPRTPGVDFMSAEVYSRVFRTLYSSTYLSRKESEEALKLLTYTTFRRGLSAGVASTTLAHKFGEHTLNDQSGMLINHELHDCGIIYYPRKPYLLCVMTKGSDFTVLEGVIQNISRLVYDYIWKQ